MDADDARAFLRQMTDDLIGMVGEVQESEQNNAAIQAIARVQGAGHALVAAAGMPPEVVDEAKLIAAGALAELGYLDRSQANWIGAPGPRFATPPEARPQAQTSGKPIPGPRLVRVVPLAVEVGPDHAGAIMVLTSLELYEDRVLARFSRLGGDQAKDDELRNEPWSWSVKDDTGLEVRYAGGGSSGALPFQTGTILWLPAPAVGATSLLVTMTGAGGPEPVVLSLGR